MYSAELLLALELQALEEEVPSLSADDQAKYQATTWRAMCKPWHLAVVDRLDSQRRDYPQFPNRTMPTMLGNLLRRTEDSLKNTGGDVQGFALRRRQLVSARVQQQHDQFRDRLDLYCTLVFVSGVLVASAVVMLWGRLPVWQVATCAAAFLAFSIVSYASAIASARGYCAVLRVMDAGSSATSAP